MHDVLDDLETAWHAGRSVGLATLTGTWHSAPRPPGATMLVDDDRAVGSVSGGCVEGAVYELAREVAAEGSPVLTRYGVSDGNALEVGLTCGGQLELFVQPVSATTFPELPEVVADIRSGRPVAVATVIEHPDPGLVGRRLVVRPEGDSPLPAPEERGRPRPSVSKGTSLRDGRGATAHAERGTHSGSGKLSTRQVAALTDDARGLLAQGLSEVLTYGPDGERRGEGMRVFVEAFAPPPRLIVFGAIDFASAMADQGRLLGYRVTVCDARPTFATAERLPGAHEVVVRWPHEYLREEAEAGRIDARTVLTVLTHDPKFDTPLLEVALRLERVAYVGAMGSRRTHDQRLAQLREVGITDEEIARLSSPIGLDLGARTPEETAVSIAAEIISLRWGGAGSRLSDRGGPIHHPHS
ncbi:XdhC family protein [Janibacter sp. G368]|uniref:XdhC family protein n=1 Tax=Janibacter sp. G368 TaxID=3420441 RepID=UPI003CFF4641